MVNLASITVLAQIPEPFLDEMSLPDHVGNDADMSLHIGQISFLFQSKLPPASLLERGGASQWGSPPPLGVLATLEAGKFTKCLPNTIAREITFWRNHIHSLGHLDIPQVNQRCYRNLHWLCGKSSDFWLHNFENRLWTWYLIARSRPRIL